MGLDIKENKYGRSMQSKSEKHEKSAQEGGGDKGSKWSRRKL